MVVISYHLKWAAITNRYEYDFVYELSDELLSCVMPFEILVVKGFRLQDEGQHPQQKYFSQRERYFFQKDTNTLVPF